MIEAVWSEKIGSKGVIDCDFDSESQTVVAGDGDGSVVLLDNRGKVIDRTQVDMPVWGIAQRHGPAGCEIAVAGAEKGQKRGRGYLLSDFDQVGEFDADGELWDCAFTTTGACFTSWGSTIYATDASGTVTEKVDTPGIPYGLSVDGEELTVVLHDIGVGRLRRNRHGYELSVAKQFPGACYNVYRSSRSDLVITGSKNGSVAILSTLVQERAVENGDICAIAVEGNFLLAGSLGGRVALFHLGTFAQPLRTLALPDGIWNISLDGSSGLAYVACGDGLLHCLQIDLTELSSSNVTAIRSAVRSPVEVRKLTASATTGAGIEVALGTIEDEWDRWSGDDMTAIATAARKWLKVHESPRLYYVLGMAELERSESDEAILLFQRIEKGSDYELKSLLPFGHALQLNGSIGAAIRVLRSALASIPDEQRAKYLFEIGRLHEKHGDDENALEAYELVSALDHGYPDLRSSLERIRNRQGPEEQSKIVLSPDTIEPPESGFKLSGRRTGEYDRLNYFLYEFGPPEDEAKKHMETDLMTRSLSGKLSLAGRSLDIGCATGRWPEWFAKKSYEAHGYDVAKSSIEICEQRAAQHPRLSLTFERYDVANGARLKGFFDVVTCMMGTFNHVPPDARPDFLRGVRDSLTDDSRFVMSIWNVSSPFCEFLGLDGQQAREVLRRNNVELEEVRALLDASDLAVESVTPFCFLPNQCYRVWEDEFRGGVGGLIAIENDLRTNLTAQSRSQMNFVVAKPRDGAW